MPTSLQLLISPARVHRIKKIKIKKKTFLLFVLFDVESSEHNQASVTKTFGESTD